jgi:RNA polymerase sigma factor (sigma-70 family)
LQHLRQLSSEPDSDSDRLDRFVRLADPHAFADLVHTHGPMVLHTCRRVLGDVQAAEDATQATFIVLARKARAIERPDALAGWLHGVARRVAMKARAGLAQRGQPLASGPTPVDQHPDPLVELSVRELLAIIDEEVERLPREYRLPVILCCLEGKLQEEAARQLGWTPGSVKGRLERGRKRLHARLARRGIVPAAAFAALELCRAASTAGMPAALASATVRAAVMFTQRGAATAAVSTEAARLAAEVLGSAGMSKVKVALALLLVLGMGVVGATTLTRPAAELPAQPEPVGERTPAKGEAKGHVDQEGVPLSGEPSNDANDDPLPRDAVVRFGTARFRHGEYVRSVAYSPDGKELASSSYDGAIRFWDPKTGKELRRFPKRLDSPGRIAYTAGGKELIVVEGTWSDSASREQFRGVRVWDVATGRLIRTLGSDRGNPFDARRMAATPDGSRVAFVHGASVLVFDPTQPNKPTLPNDCVTVEVAGAREVTHVALSADGRRLAVGALLKGEGPIDREKQPSFVRVYDLLTGKQTWERKGMTGNASGAFPAAAFSPDGMSLAVSFSHTEQLALLNATTGEVRTRVSSKTVGFWPFRFTADGARLYMSGWGDSNEIWDVKTGMTLASWSRGNSTVFELALSPDGKTMASAERRKIRLMNAQTGEPVMSDQGASAEVDRIELHPDGRRLLAGGYWMADSGFTIWDRKTGQPLFRYPHAATAFSLAPSGETVAVASFRNSPVLFDLEARRVIRTTPQKGMAIRWLSYSPDGRRIVYLGWFENKVHEIEPATMASQPLIVLPEGRLAALAMFPDGKRMVIAATDESGAVNLPRPAIIEIWDVPAKRKVRSLGGLVGAFPLVVAVSPDGRRVAAASAETRFTYVGGPADTRVIVWDAETGDQIHALPGGADGHRCLAFSPDGRTLAAGSEDHGLYLWELATGTARAKFIGHEGPVTAAAFAPDSSTLYTGSSDTTVLAWNLLAPPGDPIDMARAWTDLSAADGGQASRAMRALLSAPADTVTRLAGELKKSQAPDEGRIKKLIADLDSPDFSTREEASKEIIRTGRVSLPFLRDAARSQSLEVTRRAKALIEILNPHRLSDESLRQARAVELLEHIASPAARRLLAELATGARGDVLTEEARAAVERLGSK